MELMPVVQRLQLDCPDWSWYQPDGQEVQERARQPRRAVKTRTRAMLKQGLPLEYLPAGQLEQKVRPLEDWNDPGLQEVI